MLGLQHHPLRLLIPSLKFFKQILLKQTQLSWIEIGASKAVGKVGEGGEESHGRRLGGEGL